MVTVPSFLTLAVPSFGSILRGFSKLLWAVMSLAERVVTLRSLTAAPRNEITVSHIRVRSGLDTVRVNWRSIFDADPDKPRIVAGLPFFRVKEPRGEEKRTRNDA